ncbi:unnamed protein product [Clonostachys chloroleuca]|uniref:Uncharacterized protein n=1 Tax=Clonostachys chloroleuca TaxID=1926264 RepID=A0AA35MHJ2_9HYPO|nr:unnamed protein product [Clonostachys chloroleuca]
MLKKFKRALMKRWKEEDKLVHDPANYADSLDVEILEWTLSIQHATFIGLFDQLLEHLFSIVKGVHMKECAQPVNTPTKVILVGGLSQCAYLVNALTERFAGLNLRICPCPPQGRYVLQTAVDFYCFS